MRQPFLFLTSMIYLLLEIFSETSSQKGKNEFGEFLGFETITYAPIDLDAVDVSLLTEPEKEWLNQYHKKVYDTINPFLEDHEKEWLKAYTRAI